ncbi:T9SS type A sorting domain-containing protein [Ferruginibacter sp.]|nr:T9SS type A sorting domain-containing protein [Ferruginibacter sp.]
MKKTFYLLAFLIATATTSTAQCWQTISAGTLHTLAIKNDGSLWAWGDNTYGQLGDGTGVGKNIPVRVGTANNWSKVDAGYYHSMAIKTDGTLWAWGLNSNGQLGDGTDVDKNEPVQIGTATNWNQVSAAFDFTIALKNDGTLWAWGSNFYGQLGDGTTIDKNIPTQAGTATNWAKIAAGFRHSIATKTDGTIWAWGINPSGQVGDGTNIAKISPTQIGTATDWNLISAGVEHSIAVKTNGTIWAWGSNFYGQLGNGTNTDTNVPIQIGVASNWSTIGAGEYHTMSVKTDGTLWGWGTNFWGQLGDGTAFNDKNIPTQTGTGSNWNQVVAGNGHTLATQTDASLYAFGRNTDGQLGNGNNATQSTPVQINCGAILPLTWLYVEGQLQNKLSLIKWATASENNTKHFEVEQSSTAANFNKIGTVTAAGNSSVTKHYQFLQHHPIAGKNYYRIKQVDLDGRSSYSSVIVIDVKDENNSISVSPNPAQDFIKISFSSPQQKTTLRLFNQQGLLVKQQILTAGLQQQNIDVSKLAAGVYTAQLITDKAVEVLKFIKQ